MPQSRMTFRSQLPSILLSQDLCCFYWYTTYVRLSLSPISLQEHWDYKCALQLIRFVQQELLLTESSPLPHFFLWPGHFSVEWVYHILFIRRETFLLFNWDECSHRSFCVNIRWSSLGVGVPLWKLCLIIVELILTWFLPCCLVLVESPHAVPPLQVPDLVSHPWPLGRSLLVKWSSREWWGLGSASLSKLHNYAICFPTTPTSLCVFPSWSREPAGDSSFQETEP